MAEMLSFNICLKIVASEVRKTICIPTKGEKMPRVMAFLIIRKGVSGGTGRGGREPL